MTFNSFSHRAILALTLVWTLSLAGCFGTSEDKGDNGGSLITPKPGNVQDANTAGSRKTPLPVPPESGPVQPAGSSEAGAK